MGQGMNEVWYYQHMTGKGTTLLTSSEMFKVEKEILTNVAAEESCVVAGRSGFHVFAEHPNHLSILIQAPLEHRIQRLMGKQNLSHEEAEKVIKKVDDMRETYVKKYTGTSRYDTRNYDLVFNMEGKTEDEIVELILQYIG
jgi:cytidylate kinase